MDREREKQNPTINAVFEGVLALLEEGSLVVRGARRCIFWSSIVLDLLAPSYIGTLSTGKMQFAGDENSRMYVNSLKAGKKGSREIARRMGEKATQMHTATLITYEIYPYSSMARMSMYGEMTIFILLI